MTAQEMRVLLYRHYVSRCAVLFEISSDARHEGESLGGFRLHRRRRIDALTVARARKKGIGPLDLMAFEIKVDRSDFLSDLRDPLKQAGWREIAHRHAYVIPEGLAKPEEIPDGSGLLVARTGARGSQWLDWEIRAPYTTTPDIPAWLTLSFAWRMSAAEAKVRGISSSTRDDGETVEDLRGKLEHARNENGKLASQLGRAREESERWRDAYAVRGSLPCAHCGKPVRPKLRRGSASTWQHVARADEAACTSVRPHAWSSVYPADDVEPPGIPSSVPAQGAAPENETGNSGGTAS